MLKQRARGEDDKAERRRALLDAAEGLIAGGPWSEVTVAAVASASGLSKAAVFGYYATREELLLALLERELEAWLGALEAALGQGGPWSSRRVARAFGATLTGRTVLLRLLARLEGTLEQNVPAAAVRRFKVWLGERLGRTAAIVERRLAFLAEGDGVRVMLRVRAVVSGLWQMADASAVVDALLDEPALAAMRVRFEDELTPCLEALLTGMEAQAEG